MGKSQASRLKALRARLFKERAENRRRNDLFDKAIRTNDLREVGAEMYRYFYSVFSVDRGDITILTDYDEREFYDLIGWTPRDPLPPGAQYFNWAQKHCGYLRGLIEEQIFIGYRPEEERAIRDSLLLEQSMLECMVAKRPRIVNDVFTELSEKEVEEARRQRTESWMNWTLLNPESSKLLAKLHMSFHKARRLTLQGLAKQMNPFENLLRYRILHTRDFRRVKYLSERDALTGLFLRPVLAKRWERLTENPRRSRKKTVVSLGMLDLDLFKRFNDNYGHDVGDKVLRRFAQAVQETLRGTDVVGRYGGEEFVALFPGASSEQALSILKRIYARIKDMNFLPPTAWAAGGHPEPLRFSAGICTLTLRGKSGRKTFDEAIKAADDLLLHCKQSGRNCCAYWDRLGAVRKHRFD
ncbi:MAG: GGDEF domain-containing protein [Elusimicrobia bacterium]|nr:GGDEF domain-containing protein [Elusimicrobiota bacterium]